MTIQTNLEEIISRLEELRIDLVNTLGNKIDRTTLDMFDVDTSMDLTVLCQKTINIYGMATSSSEIVVPTPPSDIDSESIYCLQLDIHNKIQYCNNLLRYTLRKYDVDFHNSNKMHELIRYLDMIKQTPVLTTNFTMAYDLTEHGIITITTSQESVKLNDVINIEALYVDNSGSPLSNKSIQFWVNEALVGMQTTDNEGKCSVSYSAEDMYALYTIRCSSNNIVSEEVILKQVEEVNLSTYIEELSTGKEIVFEATCLNANKELVDDTNVDFYVNDVYFSEASTTNGVAMVSFPLGDSEDLVIKAKASQAECSKNFWWDTATEDRDKFYFGGGNHEYTENGLRIYGTTSEKGVIINKDFNFNPLEYSYTLGAFGNYTSAEKVTTRLTNDITSLSSNDVWYGYSENYKAYYGRYSGTQKKSAPIPGDRIKILCYSDKIQLYVNDELIRTDNYSGVYKNFGWYINNGRDFCVKDILVREL